jgi:hypothetical protein
MIEAGATAGALVTADRVHYANESVRVGAARTVPVLPEPKIHLVKEDGIIRAIDVTCSCGEQIRIHCEYS